MNKDRIVAIVQARMPSTRLPGKVLMEIAEKPILGHLVDRIRASNYVSDVVIATTVNQQDDQIVNFCIENKIRFFRGAEFDVLARYYETALTHKAKYIVRICSDSPLIDSALIDEMIIEFLHLGASCDYLSNTINQTYPLGLNVEIFTMSSLKEAHTHAITDYEREHVTPYIYFHPEKFSIFEKHYHTNLKNIRLTVDEQADFDLVKIIIESLLPSKQFFTLNDILSFLKEYPELVNLNAHVKQTPTAERNN